MIKKIFCPTDFSTEANNAVNYAAKLAEKLKAELVLMNIYQVPLSYTGVVGEAISEDPHDNPQLASKMLEEKCNTLKGIYNVKISFEVDFTTGSLTKSITHNADGETMIVMGTTGLQYVSDFFFGTHTYQVIKKAKCPVLVVPVNYSFKGLNNVIYAITYEEKGHQVLKPFEEFIRPFNSHLTFLHISEHNTEMSKDVFRAEKDEIEELFKNNLDQLSFEIKYSNSIRGDIEKFATEKEADLLVMAARRRSIMDILFKKEAIISDLSEVPQFPVLVFHS